MAHHPIHHPIQRSRHIASRVEAAREKIYARCPNVMRGL
jgi:hypothetical protein